MILKQKKNLKNLKKSNIRFRDKLKFKKFDVRLLLESFWCATGPQGKGKTSLNVAIFKTLHNKYNKEFKRETQEHINQLNLYGHKLSLNVSHLFYSNHDVKLSKKMKCHDVKFEDLVLPDSKYKGQHFPYRSFIEYQELDKDCDSRDWRNFDLAHKDFFKFFRHNGLTIGTDTQDFGNCDKKLRGLFTHLIFVYERVRTKRWWQIKPRYTWYFFLKNNQLAEALKELSEFVKIDVPIVQAYKFTYKGEIHDSYTSESAEPLFVNRLKNYKFRKIPDLTMSPEDIHRFCDRYVSNYGKKKSENESQGKVEG